jgi:putative endonuclease
MLDFTLNLLRKLAGIGKTANAGPQHLQTGLDGEEAAAEFIRKEGYQLLARRWGSTLQKGDLDIVAVKDDLICFIEVKTRTAHDDSPAERTVTIQKRNTLRKMARNYLNKNFKTNRPPVRFDILSVYLLPGRAAEFQHIKGAFNWSERKRSSDS